MKYFSTFSGIGGFELGIQLAYEKKLRSKNKKQGFQGIRNSKRQYSKRTDISTERLTCVGFSEIDKYASAIYQKHFPTHHNYGDITKIVAEELPDFDLLVGGFPCQAFSIAGKRGGFEDTRGTMFFELARIAKAKVPMFLLLENVKGLVSHNGGQTLEVILETLQELGYYTNYEIHNSKDHGVPQNRERIFFLCKHIKGLTNVGQSQKMNTYDKIIQEYLFQLLLNNLVEVKKLQGLASKDSILGYLLLREIKEKLPNPDISESILGGISTLTAENISQLKGEEVWQNIDMCLKNIWVYDSNELNKYTTSTAIKQIIDSKTYTYSRMFQAISLATVHLRDSQRNLWNEMLLGLTVIQENTKYARINNENEETIISESGTAHRKSELQNVRQYFAVGHLRGTRRPEVFPFGEGEQLCEESSQERGKTTEENMQDTKSGGRCAKCIDVVGSLDRHSQQARRFSSPKRENINIPKKKVRVHGPQVKDIQPYLREWIAKSDKTIAEIERIFGNQAPHHWFEKVEFASLPGVDDWVKLKSILKFDNKWDKIMTEHKLMTEYEIMKEHKDRHSKKGNGFGIVEKTPKDIASTVTTFAEKTQILKDNIYIRRLTPTECERLQGFPDGWTEGVSDTQRYKTLGNAVTVNVIRDIFEKIL